MQQPNKHTGSSIHDDMDCVLQLARDELVHLESDAEQDADSASDYQNSSASLIRVDAFLSTHLTRGGNDE